MNIEKIDSAIVNRAYKLNFDNVYKLIDFKPFILAGGALCSGKVNDYDIYPVYGNPFDTETISTFITESDEILKWCEIICKTKNALTVKVDGQVFQFCNYCKPSLKELIESFDFSHCQVGVMFKGDGEPPHADGVYYTEDFVVSNVTNNTTYTGSKYPLSSLIRTVKYAKREKFAGKSYATAIIEILKDIITRGFDDYDDFKDQLDAIDLGLHECENAYSLYTACKVKGLVKKL